MIDQIDSLKELWPSSDRDLPEEVDISKVFDNLEQAIECIDKAFEQEK